MAEETKRHDISKERIWAENMASQEKRYLRDKKKDLSETKSIALISESRVCFVNRTCIRTTQRHARVYTHTQHTYTHIRTGDAAS